MFDGAIVQHRYHSTKCLNRKCKCTEESCPWWDVEILGHGGVDGILISYVNLSGDQAKRERWKDECVDVTLFRPKDKQDEPQNSISKNLDAELSLAQVKDTGNELQQQHKQHQPPNQEQQPQPTPHQQEGEVMDTHGAATAHRNGPNHVGMMNPSSTAKEVHAAKQIHAARSTPSNNAATTVVPATNTANLPTSNNSLVTITSLEGGDDDVVVDYEPDDVAEERRSGT